MLFLVGGPSQLDTWDPKPNAPDEVRGPFTAIDTNVPGIRISEIFPKMARHADKYSLIRSCYHTATAVHDTGHQMMQTGRLFTAASSTRTRAASSATSRAAAARCGPRPASQAHRPHRRQPAARPDGRLPRQAVRPFVLNADPNDKNFTVPDLLPPDYISSVRAGRRQKMRDAVEGELAAFEQQAQAKQMDDNFGLAYRLMSSAPAREAFALDKEPESVRDRYGRTRFGQSCLLARRLIERGVRFVTVNMFETVFDEITWDIHGSKPFTDIAEMSRLVAPNFDQAYSALLEDLSDRGMLKTTVVTALGEFGRTPKVNPAGGRDHHPGVWTILMGGGPIRGGRVVGESDELGYFPKSRPVSPAEVAATMYQALGFDPHRELPGRRTGRCRWRITACGRSRSCFEEDLTQRRKAQSELFPSFLAPLRLCVRSSSPFRGPRHGGRGIPKGTTPAGVAPAATPAAGGLR